MAKGAKAVILDINEDKALEIINNLGEDKSYVYFYRYYERGSSSGGNK